MTEWFCRSCDWGLVAESQAIAHNYAGHSVVELDWKAVSTDPYYNQWDVEGRPRT